VLPSVDRFPLQPYGASRLLHGICSAGQTRQQPSLAPWSGRVLDISGGPDASPEYAYCDDICTRLTMANDPPSIAGIGGAKGGRGG
jgi:hypothetical protein